MTIRMLINATAANELRIAIVEDGELVELDIEAAETSALKGNVYKGVIHNVEGSLEAAFVDIGRHKQGFLPFSEVSPRLYPGGKRNGRKPKINEVLKRGQEIVVQVAKDAIGDKGATLTTYLSLPGRYTVLMPDSDANGISRKIEDDKVRKRIRTIAQKIEKPEGCGFIVRTAGFGQTRLALQKDLDKVVEQYQKLQKAAEIARAPSIIHSEPDLIGRTLRDFFSDEIDEVLIDTKDEYEAAVEYFREVMPTYADRIVHYQNPIPIFAYHHVEEQIEATFERRVKLPSGGSIVVDETEALVAIDVNSGKMTSEGDHERTVFKTNCEAAEEVARQLKLRDLGGIVVVDFIDMEETKNKREVERVLDEMSKEDKARYKISRINSKGLCVLTRQRIRQGMRKAFQHRCPVCTGTGWVRTAESHSLSLMRRIETRLAQGGVGEVRVLTHKETAEYILNQRRTELSSMEKRYGCRVVVAFRADMDRATDEVTYLSNKEVLSEITDRLPPREEKRSRGGRKRKRKKKRVEDGEPAEAEVEAEAEAPEEGEARSKRRRKRRRGRSEEARPAEAARVADAPEAKADKRTEEAKLEPKGSATFTGRPDPAALERARAERRARQARRAGDHATADAVLAELEAAAQRLPQDEPESAPDRAPPPPPAQATAEDGMDVRAALQVAEAVMSAEGEVDPEDLLEAARAAADGASPEGDPPEVDAAVSTDEAPTVEARTDADAGAEARSDAGDDVGARPEDAAQDALDGADGDDEGRSSKRRRRRRRGRRRRPEAEAEAEADGTSDAPPAGGSEDGVDSTPAPSLPAAPIEAADPETTAARKALLLKIFGAR